MDIILINLIKLYANNKVEVLDRPDSGLLFEKALQKSYDELISDHVFIKGNDSIRSLKIQLEKFEEDSASSKELMTRCLNHVWRISATEGAYDLNKFIDKMTILTRLTIESFQQKWNAIQIQYLIDTISVFTKYNFYFLSYTNHYPEQINDLYQKIYEKVFDLDDYAPEDMLKYNLLAKAFVKQMSKRNLKRGFFDNYSIRDGDNIKNSVLEQVAKSISLIQLISTGSLEFTDPNWSLREFEAYENSRKHRSHIIFFLIEKDAMPEIFHPSYDQWYEKINGVKYEKFYVVTNPDDFVKEIEKLINNITCFNIGLINSIPD